MMDTSIRVADLPDLFYRDRVKALVTRGLLLAEGNLHIAWAILKLGYPNVTANSLTHHSSGTPNGAP